MIKTLFYLLYFKYNFHSTYPIPLFINMFKNALSFKIILIPTTYIITKKEPIPSGMSPLKNPIPFYYLTISLSTP
mgnify:CR=1 FL=1